MTVREKVINGEKQLYQYDPTSGKLVYVGPKDNVNGTFLTQEEFEEAIKEKPKRFCNCGLIYRRIGRFFYCNKCKQHFTDKSPIVDEVNGTLDQKLNPPPKADQVLPLPALDCPDVCVECIHRGGPSYSYCGEHNTHIWKARRDKICTYDYIDAVLAQEEKDKDQ